MSGGVMPGHRWHADEDLDVMEDALQALQDAACRRGRLTVMPRDIGDTALAWFLSPAIRGRMGKTLHEWMLLQARPMTDRVPPLLIPSGGVCDALLACLVRGTPPALATWAAEQIDTLGLDELSRERIRRVQGMTSAPIVRGETRAKEEA